MAGSTGGYSRMCGSVLKTEPYLNSNTENLNWVLATYVWCEVVS